METADYAVIGAGVIGLCVARELKKRNPGAKVTVFEKENDVGRHASGRNSGVLHAGFYYTADSLKARFCAEGNRKLSAYCDSRKIPLNRCGKLVVCKDEADLPALEELLRRGRANGVDLKEFSEEDARTLEPRAKTFKKALFSPSTASVEPSRVMQALQDDARSEGISVRLSAGYLGRKGKVLRTAAGELEAGFTVNAAGLYADRVARDFGFSQEYRVLPFKGLYLYSDDPAGSLRVHVYPVPDLRNPFLGVHFTVKEDGRVKIGPTAIPAFWREQYKGFDNFSAGELAEILMRQAGLLLSSGFDFGALAVQELRKYSKARLVALASELVRGVDPRGYTRWAEPGIRAQLLHARTGKLVMDFVTEGDRDSFHILNAVSPGFTCALPFAEHVCGEIERLRR
ncbi:MAG: L-2-hydroxyglutarate oxidase [Elusimicrobiota bacterium]